MQGLKVHLRLKKIQNFGYVNGGSNLGLNVNFRILSLHFLPFLFSLSLSLSFILLQAVFSRGENREDGKQREENRVENTVFHCLVGEGKLGRQKTWKKFSLPGPHFLFSQIGRKSWREKCCHSTFPQIPRFSLLSQLQTQQSFFQTSLNSSIIRLSEYKLKNTILKLIKL